jgi:hypothetical protein
MTRPQFERANATLMAQLADAEAEANLVRRLSTTSP